MTKVESRVLVVVKKFTPMRGCVFACQSLSAHKQHSSAARARPPTTNYRLSLCVWLSRELYLAPIRMQQ